MHKGHIWNQYWNNCKDTFKKQIKESVCVHKLLKRFFLTLVNHLKQSVLFQKEKELEMNHVRLSYTIFFYHFLNKCRVFGAILQHFHWSTFSLESHNIRANIDIICGFFKLFFSRPPKTIRPYSSKLSSTWEKSKRHFCLKHTTGNENTETNFRSKMRDIPLVWKFSKIYRFLIL